MLNESSKASSSLNLRVGELVEVRSLPEILKTLSEDGTYERLPFMPEMVPFCGHQFRVFKRIHWMCVEGSPYRGMKDTVTFKNVSCSGEHHDDCKRSCPIFWKEAWLRRVQENEDRSEGRETGSVSPVWITRDEDSGKYFCQSTELESATYPIGIIGTLVAYVADIRSGNMSLVEMVKGFYASFRRKISRHPEQGPCAIIKGGLTKTPEHSLGLKPGEVVRVKQLGAIEETLDSRGRNRGLTFPMEMPQYSGKTYVVKDVIDRMIDEQSGLMRNLRHSVLLEGLTCSGSCNRGCPRNVYPIWREAWLERVPDEKKK